MCICFLQNPKVIFYHFLFYIFNLRHFLHGFEFEVGTLWAQLLLQFYTDPSETSQVS